MKKLLVPVDFSSTSDNAFIYALEIAQQLKGELVLLHTFDLPIVDSQAMPLNYPVIYETVELANFEHFKEATARFRTIAEERKLAAIPLRHILMDGDLVYSIKKVVKQENIDFVIMGTKGATGWYDSFLGTNTASVIKDVSVPVLSVPFDVSYQKIETICFTTRFREKDIEAMVKVLSIANSLDAKVKCLYIKTSKSDVKEETITKWKKIFQDEKRLSFYILSNEEVMQTITEFLTHQSIDLLAMVTYKRNFFASLFVTTTTQKLSYQLKTPILALHE